MKNTLLDMKKTESPCVRARVHACVRAWVCVACSTQRLPARLAVAAVHRPSCIWWRHVLPCTCAFARLAVTARAVRVEMPQELSLTENDSRCHRFKFAGWFTRFYFLLSLFARYY